jgi:uncharacterized Zn finger protein
MYWDFYPPYVSVAERRRNADRKVAELKKAGRRVTPVVVAGRKIAKSFWGNAWCEHLEGFSDYANRLPRGRSYLRNGSVIDLRIETGKLFALVSGSEVYEATIEIHPLERKRWKSVVKRCSGSIGSVVELLSGKLSGSVMEVLCDRAKGLFPSSHEIALDCSCPDGARLCKHLAAVLYGVGAKLDDAPELLFVLRGVDQLDLISEAGRGGRMASKGKTANALAGGELADIFGIELEQAPGPQPKRRRRAKLP